MKRDLNVSSPLNRMASLVLGWSWQTRAITNALYNCVVCLLAVFSYQKAANKNRTRIDGEDVLDKEEFVLFYNSLLHRPEVQELFDK